MPENLIYKLVLVMGLLCYGTLYGQDFDKYKWENRIVIVQASEKISEKFQNQIKEFKNSADGLIERKLIVYQCIGATCKVLNYKQKKDDDWKTKNKKEFSSLDEKVEFMVTLIGLDGGIKLQKTEVITRKALFKIIDAMPMRASELRNKNN